MTVFQFGKYKGLHMSEVPDSYIDWLVRDSEDKLKLYRTEQERRAQRIDGSFVKKIVEEGYTAMLNKNPSVDQAKLKMAYQLLIDGIRDAAAVPDPQAPF